MRGMDPPPAPANGGGFCPAISKVSSTTVVLLKLVRRDRATQSVSGGRQSSEYARSR